MFLVIFPFSLPLSVNYGFPGGLLGVPPLSLLDSCLDLGSLVFGQSFKPLLGQESAHLHHHAQSPVLLSYSVKGLTKLLGFPPLFRGRWVQGESCLILLSLLAGDLCYLPMFLRPYLMR